MPRIIPVIDLMNGIVVHGVGGRRDEYRPLKSGIVESCEPRHVAEAMLAMTRAAELYIADLDAIRSDGTPSPVVLQLIGELPCTIWLDHGIRTVRDLQSYSTNVNVIVGTETCAGPGELAAILEAVGSDRVAVSIDLMNGRLLGPCESWSVANSDCLIMLEKIIACGVRTLIVLDLAAVGGNVASGLAQETDWLLNHHPDVTVIRGGGFNTREQIDSLCGVDAVLCATAIHDGRLP